MSRRFQGGIVAASYDGLKAPNAPTIGTAAAGGGQVAVSFTAPSNVGGSNVSSYAVSVSPGGFGASGTSSPVTVTGLTNGTTYTFSVAAINSYGFSPYSGTVTATPIFAVEDVFSTYLYTGTGAAQTITNGIDLSGQGGMVWIKDRSSTPSHAVFDTARGASNYLITNANSSESNSTASLNAFLSNGFSLGALSQINATADKFVSWTFRKAPKFFDVVTYTGNGAANRTISHNLGVTPGVIMVKKKNALGAWVTYHRSAGSNGAYPNWLYLNTTDAAQTGAAYVFPAAPTSTQFSIGDAGDVNESGYTYVAYLFAHDATADGIIQCGSFTTDSSGKATVNLGWEPQWVLYKAADSGVGNWWLYDIMRGMSASTGNAYLNPNLSNAEGIDTSTRYIEPTATGINFGPGNGIGSSLNFVYIAIRRGPMKTPTVGTSVFAPVAYTGNGTTQTVGTLQATDSALMRPSRGFAADPVFFDRLRGNGRRIYTDSTSAEATNATFMQFTNSMNVTVGTDTEYNGSGASNLAYLFRRAPGFFDVVCYTGTGAARTVNHNLGVAPELMILKSRSGAGTLWYVYSSQLGIDKALKLNTTDQAYSGFSGIFNNTVPSATTFSLATTNSDTNASGATYVAYLFASCPGVSKVGSYTGNGSSQTINCGFTTGARFFLVKASSTTGNWWVWDSARGITAPADPALTLNTNAAEITSADATDPDNSGIIVNQEATCSINASGVTYIFLAIS